MFEGLRVRLQKIQGKLEENIAKTATQTQSSLCLILLVFDVVEIVVAAVEDGVSTQTIGLMNLKVKDN